MTDKNKNNIIYKIFLEEWRPYLWLVVIGYLLYSQIFSFGLTYLDDNYAVLVKARFNSDAVNIFQVFRQNMFFAPHQYVGYYRPIAAVVDIFDSLIGSTAPFIFHFTNILLHILNSCLLFLILIKLGYKKSPVFFASLVFTVHPALAQNVAWIPGRADSMLAAFILPAFIFFLLFLETKKRRYYFLHMLFFLLALFTKEIAPVAALCCLTYLYLVKKEPLLSFNAKILTTGWAFLFAIWFFIREAASVNPMPLMHTNMLRNMFLNLPVIIIYLGKLVLPVNLSVLAFMRDTSLTYGYIASVVIIALLLFSRNKRNDLVVFGFVWFILFLLPAFVLSTPGSNNFVYEHRTYLPAVGFIIMMLETDMLKNLDMEKPRVFLICAAVIAVLSFMSFIHSRDFSGGKVFWENAVRTSPHSSLAHRNLGVIYYMNGQIDEAEKEYRKAFDLNPYEPAIHTSLGLIYFKRGKYRAAEEEFKKEISLNPFSSDVHHDLGRVYAAQQRYKEATAEWKMALKINPENVYADRDLAIYYYIKKEYGLARQYFIEFQKYGGEVDPEILKDLNIKQ
jgi:Tfp pilus assembly protein PilF